MSMDEYEDCFVFRKNPRHGESVVIQFSVTNRRRLACGAHL